MDIPCDSGEYIQFKKWENRNSCQFYNLCGPSPDQTIMSVDITHQVVGGNLRGLGPDKNLGTT